MAPAANRWEWLAQQFEGVSSIRLRWTERDDIPADWTWWEQTDNSIAGLRFRRLADLAGKLLAPDDPRAGRVTWYRYLREQFENAVELEGGTPFSGSDGSIGVYAFRALPDAQGLSAEAAEQLAARETAAAPAPQTDQPTAVHSDDFASAHWFGQSYEFTALQAACVKTLWRNWEQGTPVVSEATIQTEAGTDSPLRTIFRGHPAWGAMIAQGSTKGRFKLQAPEAG